MKNLKKIFSVSILFSLVLALSAANMIHAEVTPSVAWSKTYSGFGAEAYSVIQNEDGGFLLLCTGLGSQGGGFYLLKVDSSGNQQWNRDYRGSIPVRGQYVVQTADGGYAVAAEYQQCFLLMKTDQSGNQLWSKTYAGVGTCGATGLVQTSDGGYALVGCSDGVNSNCLVKTDSLGNVRAYVKSTI